jgi:hypothetical protein
VRREEPGADRPVTDSKSYGDWTEALALLLWFQNPFAVYRTLPTAKCFPICPCRSNPSTHPLPYQIALKLRNCGHDSEECLPHRAAGVDDFLITDELDSQRPKFFQHREKVFS